MRRLLSIFLALLPLVAITAWLIGRLLSDRWNWSQWLSWMPTSGVIAGGLACLFSSWFLSVWCAWSRRLARFKPSKLLGRSWKVRRVSGIAMAVPALYMVVIEWRIPAGWFDPDPPADARAFSVLYWNHAGNWGKDWMETASARLSDITIMSAIRFWEHTPELMEKLNAEHPLNTQAGRWHYDRVGFYAVISKWPVKRWSKGGLNLPVFQTKLRPYATTFESGWYWNRGEAAWIEFDSSAELGHDLVIWVMDLPSDPRLHRTLVTRTARQTMAQSRFPVRVRGPVGQWLTEPASEAGFPAPDLIVGDFNIPRRAWSLQFLVGDFKPVFEEVGFGPDGTYPRQIPMLGIDQMFASRSLVPFDYELFDPGFGTHLAQQGVFGMIAPAGAKAPVTPSAPADQSPAQPAE